MEIESKQLDEYKAKTVKEAIERCFICDDTVDLDLLYEQPRRPFDWVYKNLKDSIIRVCELNNNPKLLQVCNTKTADEAAKVIIEALWKQSDPENQQYPYKLENVRI